MRHGLTEMNKQHLINGWLDDRLVIEGIEQAKNAVAFIPKSVKHIYASPLSRAKQTAEIINQELKLNISFHDELKEVNFGDLSGQPWPGASKTIQKNLYYDWRPSGESIDDVKKRLLKVLKRINKESVDGEALIVSHGGIIRLMHFLQFGENTASINNATILTFDLDKILE